MKRKKRSKHSKVLGVYFTYVGAKFPGRIEPKFFLEVDIRDVITCFKFGDDRFRGLASAEGQILPFPFDFDGRPYNTLTLPCERVISCFIRVADMPFRRRLTSLYLPSATASLQLANGLFQLPSGMTFLWK